MVVRTLRSTLRWAQRHARILGPIAALLLLGIWARWAPMRPLFDTPSSTVLLDRNGALLAATVAYDGQWRMPRSDSLPERFVECLLQFEDRHFRDHWGVHLPSLLRAWKQNRAAGRTVSGGSTLTMQLARMSFGNAARSYLNKITETLLALRIELRHDKDEILRIYASNAPFGSNVVGLEAAAWRWFGRDAWHLSWAESATLAVLPNAPTRMNPGRGREALQNKRDRLLTRLLEIGRIDSMEWSLATAEPLPDAPLPLPRSAPHLLATLQQRGLRGTRIHSTLDGHLQDRATALTEQHAAALRANEVHNAAVLILDLPTGEVLAYVGNLYSAGSDHAGAVDIVQARRSTGSLLKPFLYANMLQQGELMPDQLVADLPTRYEGFAPRNYDERYSGAVPASRALARSLNIPAVRALREHGIDRTLRMLRAMGMLQLDRSADHYGLSLILGGGESTLWEMTGAYASLGRILLQGSRPASDAALVHPPTAIPQQFQLNNNANAALGAAAAYHTVLALQELQRPETESGWQSFAGNERIAWKTGTSFGHRDAWAIGITDRYAVGIWTGNASGEGRPGLTGSLAAAPLLFEVFGILPDGRGFDVPYDALERMPVCRRSGHRAATDCSPVDTLWTIPKAIRTALCPYHQRVLVNAAHTYRTRPGSDGVWATWFVLPPAMEAYLAMDAGYTPLPPWAPGEIPEGDAGIMEFIYPERGARLFIPLQLDGTHGKVGLEAAHRERDAVVHWDLDGEHVGSTRGEHRITLDLPAGRHELTLTDRYGRSISTRFTVERGEAPSP